MQKIIITTLSLMFCLLATAALAEDLAQIESPNSRKPLAEVATDRFPLV